MASKLELAKQHAASFNVEEELDNLEQLVDRCRVMYEQYFMGIQKMPPSQLHKRAERIMMQMTQGRIANTSHRFRFNTLSQKYGSYSTYWKRTLRLIEQGKYLPHLQQAARRRAREGKQLPEEMVQSLPKLLREKILRDRERMAERDAREAARHASPEPAGVVRAPKPSAHTLVDEGDLDFDAMFDAIKLGDSAKPEPEPRAAASPPASAAGPATPSPRPRPPAPSPPPPPPPPRPQATGAPPPRPSAGHEAAAARTRRLSSDGHELPPGMSEHETRDLFDKYAKAKRLVGDDMSRVSYQKLLRTLNQQAPAIMAQHKAKRVEFDVVIKDDRVVLKAKPRP